MPSSAPLARRLALMLAAAAAVAALVVPAAGAAPAAPRAAADTDAAMWTQRVCSAMVDWAGIASAKADSIGSKIDPNNLKQARAVFSRFLDDMVKETDRMVTRIDAAGTPAVKNGPAIRQRLRTLLKQARALLADARRTAATLSVTDSKAFGDGATKVGDAISKQFDLLGGGFDRLDKDFPSPELDKAVAASKACSKL